MNEQVSPDLVEKLYPFSTIIYLATTDFERKAFRSVLGKRNNLMIDVSAAETDISDLLSKYRNFILIAKKEHDVVKFDDQLVAELEKAEQLVQQGNEHFYNVREVFESLGRRKLVDTMIKTKGYKLPARTDYE
ncbi:hypothetical protein, partial [Salmonella enterica]|uniref:hypothetical protein n=1 Tax=Salmonella enterica TaxID=28901 RepID=UPI0035241982